MLRKILLTICLAFSCLTVTAKDYSNYSNYQLQQEYKKLAQIHQEDIKELLVFIENTQKKYAEERVTFATFLDYLASGYYSKINKNYTLNGYTYRNDPRTKTFINLSNVCAYMVLRESQSKNSVKFDHSRNCYFIGFLYLLIDHNENTLNTLFFAGTLINIEKKNPSARTPKEQRMLKMIGNYQNYDLGFDRSLPSNEHMQNKELIKMIYTVFNIHIVGIK